MDSIPYGYHWVEEEDAEAVARVLRGRWITQGPLIREFEERVAARCGARYAVAFSSGTAALHAACFAAGVGPEDEVVTTPMTFVASANAILYQGGRPVFADIHPETLNIDPARIPEQITSRTKALLPVHFAGLPCRMEEIAHLARARGLAVIEDASHALGAEWTTAVGGVEKIGSCSHSDLTVFSFHPVKHITTGEGGMVLTRREDLRDRLRAFRHHGIVQRPGEEGETDEPWCFQMEELGYNYRITDFQCALGLKQMERLEFFLNRRAEIARRYRQELADLGLGWQEDSRPGIRHAWHLCVVRLPLEQLVKSRKEIYRALRAEGIGVNVHYLPVPLQPFYRRRFGYRPGQFPVAEGYYERALTLPLFPRMSDGDLERVVTLFRKVLQEGRRPHGALKSEPQGAALR